MALALPILVFLGLVFLPSGAGHLLSVKRFALVVAEYRLVPQPLVVLVAIAVAGGEVVAGLLCLSGVAVGAALAVLMLMIFSAALAWNLADGRVGFECGCLGGSRTQPVSWSLVIRNLMLAALGLVAIAVTGSGATEVGWTASPGGFGGGVAAILTASSAYVVLLVSSELDSLARANRGVRTA